MTTREVLGLVVLNLSFGGIGAAVLWAIGGWRSWGDLGRLAGVAYFVGIATFVIVLTAELVIGVGFSLESLLATGFAITACAVAAGRLSGRRVPSIEVSSWTLPRLPLTSALWVSGLILFFEALFRASRLAPVGEWDAWWVWTIRAKALFYFGNIGGPELVNGDVSDYPSYPPGLSFVHAAAFEAMGTVDAVALHLQHWFLALGFVLAAVGLLSQRLRSSVLLPLIVIAVTMPLFVAWSTWLLADLMLAFQIAIAAILVYEWLERRETWRIVCATVLLAGAILTKREAVLVVGCVLLAGIAASWRDRAWAWPRLVAAGLATVVLALPWWASAFRGAGPSAGFLGPFDHPERIWPAFRLIAGVFVDLDLTLGAGVLAAIVLLIAFRAGAPTPAIFLAVFAGASLVAATVVFASEPLFEFSRIPELSPVQRLVLVLLVSVVPLTVLVLGEVLQQMGVAHPASRSVQTTYGRASWRLLAPWALVGVLALAYPALLSVGYSGFPFG